VRFPATGDRSATFEKFAIPVFRVSAVAARDDRLAELEIDTAAAEEHASNRVRLGAALSPVTNRSCRPSKLPPPSSTATRNAGSGVTAADGSADPPGAESTGERDRSCAPAPPSTIWTTAVTGVRPKEINFTTNRETIPVIIRG